MALNYSNYLKLDELLSLQEPRSSPPEHDEYLFIVIHQTYELWFKLLMIELERIKAAFSGNRKSRLAPDRQDTEAAVRLCGTTLVRLQRTDATLRQRRVGDSTCKPTYPRPDLPRSQ